MGFQGTGKYPEGKVGAGIDTIVLQDGRIIQYAADCSLQTDYELEGIRTLGYYGNRDFKSLGFTGKMTVGTFLIMGADDPGALTLPGWQPDGTNTINSAGYFDFVFCDLHTLQVLKTSLKCKLASEDQSFGTRELNRNNTQWDCTKILPGLQTS